MTATNPNPTTRRRAIVLVIVLVVAFLALVGTVFGTALWAQHPTTRPAPEHPTAAVMALAKKYLGAISDGDAATARAIDKAAYPGDQGVDSTTFIDSAALKDATARIANMKYTLGGNFQNESWVDTSFTLAGKTYKAQLLFEWDDSAKAWALHTDIAQLVDVVGYTTDIDEAPLPYSLSGVHAAALATGVNNLYVASLVYPGAYPLVVDVDPSKLANPATPTTTTLLVPPDPYKGGSARFLLKAPIS